MSISGERLVKDAMYGAQLLGVDEPLADADAQLVLRRLNRLFGMWSNMPLTVYADTTESFTMTAGVGQYSSSLLASGRPTKVSSMYVRLSDIDWPVELIDEQTYEAIGYKQTTGVPNSCFVDTTFTDMQFYFYPLPYAAFTCFVTSQYAVSGDITLASTLSLPPGYEAALIDALAVDICPSFGKQATPDMKQAAANSRRALALTNYKPVEMETGIGATRLSPDAFIYKGF